MSKREDYEAKTEALLGPIAEANGVSIYDVEYVKEGSDYYLRAFIDKPQGVNIKDCENVSRALSDALDREDFIPDSYILEVRSPVLGPWTNAGNFRESSGALTGTASLSFRRRGPGASGAAILR